MKIGTLAVAVAMVVASASYTSAQAPVPAAKKAAEKTQANDKAGERGERAETKGSSNVKNQVDALPAIVKATVEAETKNATVKGVSKEKENGKIVYELESLVNGRTRDLMIDSAGKIYVIEEQVDVDKAPAPVKAALEARGRIVTLESVMENGKTHYEGQVQTKGGKKVAMEVEADGTPIKK
jgi:uncharacterized membrane protein YkoI